MENVVTYRSDGAVATIDLDDGRVNVLSGATLAALGAALDRAEAEGLPVVLAGRPGIFSAGFDLDVLRNGGTEALDMLRAGFELSARLLAFPTPVVIACTGHTIAMGLFLLLSGDHRLGAESPSRLTANEVAIGLTMPRAAVEICRHRLTPAHFTRAVILAEVYAPDTAVAAGILDRVVPAGALRSTAYETAAGLAALDPRAHRETKLRARAETLAALRAAIEVDDAELRVDA